MAHHEGLKARAAAQRRDRWLLPYPGFFFRDGRPVSSEVPVGSLAVMVNTRESSYSCKATRESAECSVEAEFLTEM